MIASLGRHAVICTSQQTPTESFSLNKCVVHYFDADKDAPFQAWNHRSVSTETINQLFVPKKYNHPGYDAIYVSKEEPMQAEARTEATASSSSSEQPALQLVFLQFTRAEKKDKFDREPFWKSLHMLKEKYPNIGNIELWYVVPGVRLMDFKTPTDILNSFRKDAVECAFANAYHACRDDDHEHECPTGTKKLRVRVIGVDYDLQGGTRGIWAPKT